LPETTFSPRTQGRCGPSVTARLIAVTAAALGAFVCTRPYALIGIWLVALVPLHVITKTARALWYTVTIVVLPIGIMSLAIWGFLIGAPPGALVGSDPDGGIEFGATVAFRVAVIASIAQLCLLTIPADQLPVALRRFGLRGDILVVLLVSFTILAELRLRASQVITARTSRGLRRTSLPGRVRDLLPMMIPVVTWTLRSAVQRADTWQQRRLLGRIEELAGIDQKSSSMLSWILVTAACGWLAATILIRVLVQ